MKTVLDSPRSLSRESLRGIRYEETVPEKPPIPITTAKAAQDAQLKGVAGFQRTRAAKQLSPKNSPSKFKHDVRRDSGLAPSSSTARDSETTLGTEPESTSSIRQSPSLRIVSAEDDPAKTDIHPPASRSDAEPLSLINSQETTPKQTVASPSPTPFLGILTEIPTGSFEDLTMPGQVQFSKRGSMLIAGKRATQSTSDLVGNGRATANRPESKRSLLKPPSHLPSRALSPDDETTSNRVRSMYYSGIDTERLKNMTNGHRTEEARSRAASRERLRSAERAVGLGLTSASSSPLASRSGANSNEHLRNLLKGPNELAGGIEDWEDINNEDIDRYGFIVPRKLSSQASSLNSPRVNSPDPPRLQRVSTLLQLASDTPRRNHSRLRSGRSAKSPTRSTDADSTRRQESVNIRPKSSQSSYRSTSGQSRLRFATNHFPHNKDRRCVDEAGDMLTLPPGLADIAEDQEDNRVAYDLKRREWDREEKWRKMAKLVKRDTHGGGMVFDFDTKNPKLVERTWKGIPDKWRATAWHAFLTTSAKKRNLFIPDEDLIRTFKALLDQGSPDDFQIDLDVPRTVNSHVMFRRRYRGGQRLLFRVLHCVSIYFPETGYVQGMAALAATLLCYFDEEMAFVMMVRLWELRGLDRLYKPSFEGLMQALDEFGKNWLRNGEVSAKLSDLDIPPTSYGTRWYLTLFNYSIPFPAQLRVWDVFMLLGDPDTNNSIDSKDASFHGGLDVLHACSAALIDGTREILLDSDFENAMKVLTSWIPVKDEEMLMRVAKIEWKMKRKRDGGHQK